MSMLSTQCDELRRLAGDGSMEWTGPIRASVLLDAADAIERLRDTAQELGEERDQLRQAVGYWQRMYEEQIGVRR